MGNIKYWERYNEIQEIAKERGGQYGDIVTNFSSISSILDTNYGLELKPSQIIEVMIATKISREKNKHKIDNTDDNINYNRIRDELLDMGL